MPRGSIFSDPLTPELIEAYRTGEIVPSTTEDLPMVQYARSSWAPLGPNSWYSASVEAANQLRLNPFSGLLTPQQRSSLGTLTTQLMRGAVQTDSETAPDQGLPASNLPQTTYSNIPSAASNLSRAFSKTAFGERI